MTEKCSVRQSSAGAGLVADCPSERSDYILFGPSGRSSDARLISVTVIDDIDT